MADKALYVMAGFDAASEAYLAGIQNNLYSNGFAGIHTKNLPQHITLDSFPMEQEQALIQKIREIAASTESFDVCFNHVGIFGGSKVLFIAPDINRPLLKLKEQFGDSFDWTPHTTMLLDEPDKIRQALPLVMDEFQPFVARVSELELFEFWPARHIMTVKLQ